MKNTRAKSFVTIMLVIAFLAVLLRIAIDRIIESSITQNESSAQETLKLVSAGLESFARDNRGLYPTDFSSLTKPQPAYLYKDYAKQFSLKGYNYDCPRLEQSGYSCQAQPVKCRLTGRNVFTITTGSILVGQECSNKE